MEKHEPIETWETRKEAWNTDCLHYLRITYDNIYLHTSYRPFAFLGTWYPLFNQSPTELGKVWKGSLNSLGNEGSS